VRSIAWRTPFKAISKVAVVAVVVLVGTQSLLVHANDLPNSEMTPGLVCTETDRDFKGFEYPERIARCKRNFKQNEKIQVAQDYGDIPEEDWSDYEFDHLIPLCAGGSNNLKNVWPQPLEQAKKKDVLENEVCVGLRKGTMLQTVAIGKLRDWFDTLRTRAQSHGESQTPERMLIFEKAWRTFGN
jgi:hypothetical protein